MNTQLTEQIFREYHSKLFYFVRKRVDHFDDAEDILQNVFLKIHSRIDTLKDKTKLQAWIYQITRNTIVDYFRTNKPVKQLPKMLAQPETELYEETRREITDCFLPLIKTLPIKNKQALILSEIDGLSQKDVADKEGLSLTAAKSRIQRGRKKIKDTLLDYCQFKFDSQGKVFDYESKTPNEKNCC